MERIWKEKEVRLLICKQCGFADNSSSDNWRVTREDEDSKLLCPACGQDELIKIELKVSV
jgi:predicted RNA-binding Zn-ribbon protein involved in translation (DUF1610 family)